VDPSIPKAWDGYRVTREFRGDLYQITVKNPNHVSKGVVKMIVDGKEVKGNIIPLAGDKKMHEVEVVLG
jgi:cellobiose phosphorylase